MASLTTLGGVSVGSSLCNDGEAELLRGMADLRKALHVPPQTVARLVVALSMRPY
jgi:hypothetical protein